MHFCKCNVDLFFVFMLFIYFHGFSANLPAARKEITRLNKYSTPMGKLYCIQRVIAALMRSHKTPESPTEGR